jgi:hypothetical protein
VPFRSFKRGPVSQREFRVHCQSYSVRCHFFLCLFPVTDKTVVCSSYIYQRMDFDKGMHSVPIAMLLNRMDNFHFDRERLADALKCYIRGLCIEKKVLPPDCPNIIDVQQSW